MALPVRRLPRPRVIAGEGVTSQKVVQERYFVKLVRNNFHYRQLIASLKAGISVSQVAEYFAKEGWIDVNQRTFADALRTWRKLHPEEVDNATAEGMDEHVSPNQPFLDELNVANQLLRLQQLRLGIAFTNEKSFSLLIKDNAKEVEVATKLIETIAKIKGKINDGGRAHVQEPANVMEDLSKVKKDEVARDRLHHMVKQVVEAKA